MSKIQKSFPSTSKKAVVTDPITKLVFFVFFCEHNFLYFFFGDFLTILGFGIWMEFWIGWIVQNPFLIVFKSI